MRMTFPRPTPVVKRLLIINIVVFFAQILGADDFLTTWFSVLPVSPQVSLQLWRLITYQFLHVGLIHILFNMVALFFLGPMLEKHWNSRKFLIFYLFCGIIGGLFYTALANIGFLVVGPMVGASGSILGIIGACAVLFPQIKLIIFPIFIPISIRVVAIACAVIYTLLILMRADNAGGEAAHLAGMAAGAFYVWYPKLRAKLRFRTLGQKWKRKIEEQRNLETELDRILQKVHNNGIHSLTTKEKRILRKATKAKQNRL